MDAEQKDALRKRLYAHFNVKNQDKSSLKKNEADGYLETLSNAKELSTKFSLAYFQDKFGVSLFFGIV